MNLGFTYLALSGGELGDKPFNSLPAGGAAVLGLVFVATLLAAQSALLARLPSFQRVCTLLTGNDEWTSVRQLALATVVSFTVVCCVPLAALGQPPLLQALQSSPGAVSLITDGRGAAGMLRDQMYALTWTLMAAALAVGYGIRRNGPETLERLGLKRISIRQLGGAVLLTGLLLGLAQLADVGITRLWQGFGWPMTDLAAVEALFDPFISPLGAVVIGITAGVGEEVAVRGILQPRLGILLSNLFFTALHAYQYNWDGLFSVFLTGLALGFIRKQTSTTVSAIVHGGFDFVLVIAAVLQGGAGE
jgi:membrane protease YdiL (CAAX protease family)